MTDLKAEAEGAIVALSDESRDNGSGRQYADEQAAKIRGYIRGLERDLAEAVALLRDLLDSQRDLESEYCINTNAGCAIAELLAKQEKP